MSDNPQVPAAFPRPCSTDPLLDRYEAAQTGMALRDWFAGLALAGTFNGVPLLAGQTEKIAADAYRIADAMLAARDK